MEPRTSCTPKSCSAELATLFQAILERNSAFRVCQDPAIGEISPLTQLSNLLNSAFYAGPVIASCARHEDSCRH
jgi:hypothetical protein